MRGDKELQCLELVKNNFPKDYAYQKGMNEQNFQLLKNIVDTVKPNSEINDFPDFISKDSFIEHFQITSSVETKRKGSAQSKRDAIFEQDFQKGIKRAQKSGYKGVIHPQTYKVTGHSYENLKNSFIKNWKNHIESLRKYEKSYKTGIFLIQYSDFALEMGELLPEDAPKDKVSDVKHNYYLSKDKDLLKYIAEFENEIRFVVFVNTEAFEIIDLKEIKNKVNSMNDWMILPVFGIRSAYAVPLDIDLGDNDD